MSLNDQLNGKIEELANRGEEVVQTDDPLMVEATLLVARMIAMTHDDDVRKAEVGHVNREAEKRSEEYHKYRNETNLERIVKAINRLPDFSNFVYQSEKIRNRIEHVVMMMAAVGAAFWFLALLTIAYYISGGVL